MLNVHCNMAMKVETLRDALKGEKPHPALIYAAQYLVTEYDSDHLPDWVMMLATTKNFQTWEDVIAEVRKAMLQ